MPPVPFVGILDCLRGVSVFGVEVVDEEPKRPVGDFTSPADTREAAERSEEELEAGLIPDLELPVTTQGLTY